MVEYMRGRSVVGDGVFAIKRSSRHRRLWQAALIMV